MRPEGVLEFLRIMDGHEWRDDGTGGKEYLPKIPAETPVGFVRLSSFQGDKPVLLYFSNPYDWVGPGLLGEVEALYQAYRDRVQFYYVAHIIGDWHHGLGHEYSMNALASKAKVMYMMRPFMSIPCLLDDLSCPAKNAYHRTANVSMIDWTMKSKVTFLDGAWPAYLSERPIPSRVAGFVQGSCVLIDKDGRVAASFAEGYQWDPNRANLYERAIRSLLARGGRCAPEAVGKECFIGEWRVSAPKQITLTLERATVVSIDVGRGEITADAMLRGETKRYAFRVGRHTRLESSGTSFDLAELKPGTEVSAEFYADGYLGKNLTVTEKASKEKIWDRALCEITGARSSVTAIVRGNGRGGWTHPRGVGYTIESDDGSGVVAVRAVHAQVSRFDRERQTRAGAELVLCGRITALDPRTRVVTVQQNQSEPRDFIGYRLWRQGGQSTARHFPSVKAGAALQRRRVVAGWMEALAKGPVRRDLLLDDAVEIIINGTWDHKFDELKVGDPIGVRYTVIQDDGKLIRPDWVRISKPA